MEEKEKYKSSMERAQLLKQAASGDDDAAAKLRAEAHQGGMVALGVLSQGRGQVAESDMKTWASGAKRSKAMPSYDMLPRRALKEIIKRFDIGRKYGRNNWRKAALAARGTWRNGEREGTSPLDFIRQFYDHMEEHFSNVVELCGQPAGAVSEKGDNLLQNAGAMAWNALALVEYLIMNEEMFRVAFSEEPSPEPATSNEDLSQQHLRPGTSDDAKNWRKPFPLPRYWTASGFSEALRRGGLWEENTQTMLYPDGSIDKRTS